MGNQQSNISAASLKRKLSRSGSTVPEVDRPSSIVGIDRLAKILSQSSSTEDSVYGITCRAFMRQLLPQFPQLALRLFGYMHTMGGCTSVDRMPVSVFKTQAEKLLSYTDDNTLIEVYVKMFAACNTELQRSNFQDLIMTGYRLAMDHYQDGPQTCIQIHSTVDAVLQGAYHAKDEVTVGYAAHWIQKNCPRLVESIHKYLVHIFSTAYREKLLHREASTTSSRRPSRDTDSSTSDLEATTPVLEKSSQWGSKRRIHLPLSQVWLLSASLPPIYSKPTDSTANNPISPLTPHDILMRMMVVQCPSHWVPLYNSAVHGCGANRFLTHVTNYRGPTIVLLISGEFKFLIAMPDEWKESHLYRGSAESAIIQLNPEFHAIESGPKLVYLNCSIRGYPLGLRAGSDPRKPVLSVDGDFVRIEHKGVPYILDSIEVWGCGLPEQREAQVAVKKWQVKEAERQRVVKIKAEDWVDHPDRYLLELNGRAVYNSKSN